MTPVRQTIKLPSEWPSLLPIKTTPTHPNSDFIIHNKPSSLQPNGGVAQNIQVKLARAKRRCSSPRLRKRTRPKAHLACDEDSGSIPPFTKKIPLRVNYLTGIS